MLLGGFGGEEIYNSLKAMVTDDMLADKNREEFARYNYDDQVNDDYSLQVKKILNYFLDYTHKDAILGRLMQSYYGNEAMLAQQFYLDVPQMAEMQRAGMVIGSHTVSHPVLSRLTVEQQSEEIQRSFKWLDDTLQLPVKTFCYPYGGSHSFTNETERILQQNNVACTFNVEPRDIEARDLVDRKTALPRFDCNQFAFGQVRTLDN
jgi:hypothetical protein